MGIWYLPQKVLPIAAIALLLALVKLAPAAATHEDTLMPRPAHANECTAHASTLPAGAVAGMQSGYDYWNLNAAVRTLNSYQNPVAFSGQRCDLVVDYVTELQDSCIYDFNHCQRPRSSAYAQIFRHVDLNVGHLVWNASKYADNIPPVDGQLWNNYVGRHELGHDQRLLDHTEKQYTGLMCNVDTCNRRSAATTKELNAAAKSFAARPIPASSISVLSSDSTTVMIQFSGQGNADTLVPSRSAPNFLAGWIDVATIPVSSTTYTFIGLTPNTTYNFRIVSRKAGQPDGSSHWVTATTTAVPPIGRVSNFTVDANDGANATMTWSALLGAVAYELCISNAPNSGWICASAGSGTSVSAAVPNTSSKAVWYYGVRGVDSGGVRGAISNRGTLSRFNEAISGVVYASYQTAYKDAAGIKRVNGFNQHTFPVWLVFNNGNGSQNIFANPSGNAKMFASVASWNVPDNDGAFGPTILAVESPNSSFLPQDSIAHSTICMVISAACN